MLIGFLDRQPPIPISGSPHTTSSSCQGNNGRWLYIFSIIIRPYVWLRLLGVSWWDPGGGTWQKNSTVESLVVFFNCFGPESWRVNLSTTEIFLKKKMVMYTGCVFVLIVFWEMNKKYQCFIGLLKKITMTYHQTQGDFLLHRTFILESFFFVSERTKSQWFLWN